MHRKIDLTRWNELADETLFKIHEVAEILSVSQGTIRNAIHSGRIRAHCIPGAGRGTYRISKSSVTAFLEASLVEPGSRTMRPTTNTGSVATPQPFKHLDAKRLLDAWRRQDD